jgi:hypothetical protein
MTDFLALPAVGSETDSHGGEQTATAADKDGRKGIVHLQGSDGNLNA